jgi:hypothetical protein
MPEESKLDIIDPLKTLSRARRLKRAGKLSDEEFARIRAEAFAAMGNAGVKAIQDKKEGDE